MSTPADIRDSGAAYTSILPFSALSEDIWTNRFIDQAIIALRYQPDLANTFAMLKNLGLPEKIVSALNTIINDASLITLFRQG